MQGQNNNSQRNNIKCDFCGKRGHTADDCWQRNNIKCDFCGKIGHTSDDCWQKKIQVDLITELISKNLTMGPSNGSPNQESIRQTRLMSIPEELPQFVPVQRTNQ